MNNATTSTRVFHIKQLHLLLITASIFFINGVLMKTLDQLAYDLNGLALAFNQTNLNSFISLSYITTLIGGIASKTYKCSNNILIGYVLVVIGLFSALQPNIYLIGMTTYIVGSGLIIPNTYMYLSHQYAINSSPRTQYLLGLFAISSIGLTVGLLTGHRLIQYGPNAELLLLSGITLVSLLSFITINYDNASRSAIRTSLANAFQQIEYTVMINILIFGGIGLFSYMLSFPWLLNWILVGTTLVVFVFIVSLTAKSHSEQRARNMIILCLFFLAASYWITNTILTYCLSTYLPLKQIFNVAHFNTFSLTTMVMTLEMIGSSATLLILMLLIYLLAKFYHKAISFISLVGIAVIGTAISVVIFNLLTHIPAILSTTQHKLAAVGLLGMMTVIKALAIPGIIVLIGQLTPRRQEGLFISFFLTTLGLSLIIGHQFLNSVNWTIKLPCSHPVYSYYQLGLVALILNIAAFVLFFGLLKPIWNTAKTLG